MDADGKVIEIREDLVTNIAHPDRWYDTLEVLRELGAELFIEMAPGHVSTHLVAQCFPGVRPVYRRSRPPLRDCSRRPRKYVQKIEPAGLNRLEPVDQGTLFLDKVGAIPFKLQPKLLR